MHNPRSSLWLWVLVALISLHNAISQSIAAKEYVVRQVTNFNNVGLQESVTPIGIVDGDLLFYGYDNNQGQYYRTDGISVTPIDNPLNAMAPIGEPTRLGSELYFSARGDDGAELFAINGQRIRQVADINSGPVDTPIRELHVINGQLVFGAGTPNTFNLHRSNGFEVDRFPDPNPSIVDGAVQLGNRLLMHGAQIYWTDGLAIGSFSSPQIATSLDIVKAGDAAYFATVSGRIYRTDAITATPIVQAPASVVSMFEINGALHFASYSSFPKTDLSFFRIENDSATKLLDWQVPDEVDLRASAFDQQPVLVSGGNAYFSYARRGKFELYKFDGDSFDLISDQFLNSFGEDRAIEAGGRAFFNLPISALDFGLYEDVDGDLIRIGPGLRGLTAFENDMFAVSKLTSRFADGNAVWQLVDDEFEILADIPADEGNFFEFNRKLYFGGQYDYHGRGSSTMQLYEIVAVPEPSVAIHGLFVAVCSAGIRSTWRYRIG